MILEYRKLLTIWEYLIENFAIVSECDAISRHIYYVGMEKYSRVYGKFIMYIL